MISFLKMILKRQLAKRRTTGLRLGPGVQLSQCSFGNNVSIGRNVTLIASGIGDYTYIGDRSSVAHAAVGRFCSVGPDVAIGSGSHPTRTWVSSHPIFYLARPALGWNLVGSDKLPEFGSTVVGNDVWIGAKVLFLDGVTVGDGAIIGGGSVVVKDVEPYGIYAGVPAKLIRYRFDQEKIAFLLNLKWWEKDIGWLAERADQFSNIDHLLNNNA